MKKKCEKNNHAMRKISFSKIVYISKDTKCIRYSEKNHIHIFIFFQKNLEIV